MNALLTARSVADITDITDITETDELTGSPPRTGLWDRLALRIGLALLIWGARPASLEPDHDLHRRMAQARTARDERALQHAHAALALYGR